MQEVSSSDKGDITSEQMHQAVVEAFKMQKQRGQQRLNGRLAEDEIEKYCILSTDAATILEGAIGKFGLSHRSIASVKKIARTIADLGEHAHMEKPDILEALSYRRRK
jgi:magnesium chelatase family protein